KDNLYYVEGGGGNSSIIIGQNGVIVVDTKTTLAAGKGIVDEVMKLTNKPITTVILTHSDADHVNGLPAFPKGITIIAHENDEKVAITGDLIGRGDPLIHLNKNGSSEGWIRFVTALTQLDADTYVLGHADPETKAQVEANLKNAEAKRARIAELVKQGKSLDD